MNHLQEAKDIMRVVEPSDILELQMALAQRALAHAVIALVERLDAVTDIEPTKDVSCVRIYAPWGLDG